jgi:hypothetical protein
MIMPNIEFEVTISFQFGSIARMQTLIYIESLLEVEQTCYSVDNVDRCV